MNRKSIEIWTLILVLQLSGAGQAATPGNRESQLLVKWRDGPGSPAAIMHNAQLGSTVLRNFNAIGWQLIQLAPSQSRIDGSEAYASMREVLSVEPNGLSAPEPPIGTSGPSPARMLHQLQTNPNDPRYREQWYLKKIDAPGAWNVTTGGTNVVIAVLDRGVNFAHPDLAANMWRNPGETGVDTAGRDRSTNGIDDDDNGYVDDVHGVDVENGTGDPRDTGHAMVFDPPEHGTFCSGIIGAVGNNGVGITGLNWNTRIMAVRFSGGDPGNTKEYVPRAYWSDNLAAWDYVLLMKRKGINVRVTSNSYADYFESLSVRDALAQAGQEGILCVFSGGNQGLDTDLRSRNPGGYNLPNVLVVAASDESDRFAFFSNFGRSTVHLAAPGVNFVSTAGNGLLTGQMGTSYACPLVAGTAGLLLSVDPGLTVDELKAALLGSVDPATGLKGRLMSNGRLNAARALESLNDPNPPAIPIHASPAGQWTRTNAPIQMTFSRPMVPESVEGAFVVSPDIRGRFHWSADRRSFSFEPETSFDSKTNYTVRLLGSARDDSGGTLDGDYDRLREGSPLDDFVFSFRFRISNDDYGNAQWIDGGSGSIQGSNRYATSELLEPDHVADRTSTSSVWYQWAAESTGWVTFDLTVGTAFDSLLAVYSGDTLDRLTTLSGNDNHGTRPGGRVSFPTVAGVTYSVAVAGKSGDETKRSVQADQSGNFRLSWYPTPAPGFTGAQFTPASGIPGARITLTGTDFTGASAVLFNGASAIFTRGTTNNLDLRLFVTVPPDATSGPVTVVTPHGNVTSSATFQVLPPALRVHLTVDRHVEIAWPATGNAFVLEAAPALLEPIWERVLIPPTIAEGWSHVIAPGTETARFFRLRANAPE